MQHHKHRRDGSSEATRVKDLSEQKQKRESLTCSLAESKGRLREYRYLDGPSNFLRSHDTQTSLGKRKR